jgi:hypothetical protein
MKDIKHCPFCEAPYALKDLRALSSESGKELCHALCQSCSRAMFYAFDQAPGSVVGLGLLTDCDGEDAARFLKAPKITLNEVLEAYEALER